MSTLKVNAILDASGGNTATINSMTPTADSLQGFRNRIINGDMRIDQRNAGASVTITNTGANTYTLDRWAAYGSAASKFSVQQNAGSVTPPVGFTNYLGCTSLSAYTVGAAEIFTLQQQIEGFNFADLNFGSANAKTVTISFWVRSSLTGSFAGFLNNSAQNRTYPFTYSISAANTWEQKSVTIAGDTTGTWIGGTNGIGAGVWFSLGCGSTYQGTANAWTASTTYGVSGQNQVVGTNGATFYITGVQLEVGSVATPFERRPYGTELMLCQRYYFKYGNLSGGNTYPIMLQCYSSTSAFGKICDLPVQMRTTPTASTSGTFTGSTAAGGAAGAFTSTLVDRPSANFLTTSGWTGSSSLVAGNVTVITMPDTAFVQASAEL
jgi:hypothetical protein